MSIPASPEIIATWERRPPAPVDVSAYTHTPSSPKAREFLRLLTQNSRANRYHLAEAVGVTVQTIHIWLRHVRANRPISPRGRRPKYAEPTLRVAIQIPMSVAEAWSKEQVAAELKMGVKAKIERLVAESLCGSMEEPRR